MAILSHTCLDCGHPAWWEDNQRCSRACPCRHPSQNADPVPIHLETFRLSDGQAEDLYEPGTYWNDGTRHRVKLCDCPACHDEYATLMGMVR